MNVQRQSSTGRVSCTTRELPELLSDFRLHDAQKREERTAELIALTSRLMRISSVSGVDKKHAHVSKENKVAEEIAAYLHGIGGLDVRLVSLERDDCEKVLGEKRKFVFAFLKGKGKKTLALTGHLDTVGFENERMLSGEVKNDFLHGRGALDMKGGVAVQVVVMKELASRRDQLNGNIALIVVPDEENDSAGIIEALRFFEKFLRTKNLECIGAISSDYTMLLHEKDDSNYVYAGAVGKILATVLVRGVETHVGEPFKGLNPNSVIAEITRRIEYNPALCDNAFGRTTPPPTALFQRDSKSSYDIITSLDAFAHYNFSTMGLSPRQVLKKLRRVCFESVTRVLADVYHSRNYYRTKNAFPSTRKHWQPRVRTFEELLAEAKEKNERIERELKTTIGQLPKDADLRSVSIASASKLVSMQHGNEPIVLLFFSPPFYPAIPPQPNSPLMQAIDEMIEGFNARREDKPLKVRPFYAYVSDVSYLSTPPGFPKHLKEFAANAPAFGQRYNVALPDFTHPVVNIGPFGYGAHKPDERMYIPYSFKLLPEILLEVIARTFEKIMVFTMWFE